MYRNVLYCIVFYCIMILKVQYDTIRKEECQMARPGVGRDEILRVAEEIFLEGKEPTQVAVRDRLGGVGSFTTISAVLKEWRASRKSPAAPIREMAPDVVIDRMERYASEIWSLALDIANERLKSEREAMEALRADMEEQQAEAAAFADQLVIEVEQLREQVSFYQSELEEVTRYTKVVEANFANLQVKESALIAQRDELEKRLSDSRDHFSFELDRLQDQIVAERDKVERLTSSDRQQLKRVVELESALQAAGVRADSDQKQIESLSARVQYVEIERDALRDELTAAKIDLSGVVGQVEVLRQQLDQVNEKYEKLVKQKSSSRSNKVSPDQQKKADQEKKAGE